WTPRFSMRHPIAKVSFRVRCRNTGPRARDMIQCRGRQFMNVQPTARFLVPMVCLLTLASATAPATQQRTAKDDEQAIIELERGWNAALYRKDLPFIENLLADEFIGTYDDGSR